jgi:predicted RNase H-like HicB family nuclease
MNPTEIATVSAANSAKAYLRLPYARILIPEEDGGFSAEMLEFPGCFAEGETADQAIHNLDEVAESWIEAAQEQGLDIPEPTANQPYAGRIALRLPRDLHRLAVRKAQRDGTSLNQYLVTAIAAWIGADNLFEKLVQRAQYTRMNFVQIAVSTPPTVQVDYGTGESYAFISGATCSLSGLNSVTYTSNFSDLGSRDGICVAGNSSSFINLAGAGAPHLTGNVMIINSWDEGSQRKSARA